jgi:hypothetical protein
MKVLLIYSEDDKEEALKVLSFFKKTGISSDSIIIKRGEDARRNIENITHVAILSALGPGWVDFLAGFFCGSHLPIIIFGEKAKETIPDVYAFCFRFMKSEEELINYLTSENNASKANEVVYESNHARQALLDRGIPPTDDALVQCVAEDKAEDVSLFLAAGYSPDTKDKKGVPLIVISARNKSLNTLKLLLGSGAQVNMVSEDRGSTALFDSAMKRNAAMVKALIEAGADTNIQDKDGQSALVVSVGAGDVDLVEMLVKSGANPDLEDSLGSSARKYATLFRNKAMLALFNEYI